MEMEKFSPNIALFYVARAGIKSKKGDNLRHRLRFVYIYNGDNIRHAVMSKPLGE